MKRGPYMFCEHCGAPVDDDAKYCGVCGQPRASKHAKHKKPEESRERGCLSQAFNDMTKMKGVLKRVCQISFVPALLGIVSVVMLFIPVIGGILAACGAVATYVAYTCGKGWAIEWGRDLSLDKGKDTKAPLMRSSLFSIGVISQAVSGALGLVALIPVAGAILSAIESVVFGSAVAYSYYGESGVDGVVYGSLGAFILGVLVALVLAVFLGMFGDACIMHLAVSGRVESAFSLKRVWKPYKKNLGKLFCASVLPEILVAVVVDIVSWLVVAIFGGLAIAGIRAEYYGYGYSYGYTSDVSNLDALVYTGGVLLVVACALIVFLAVISKVFGNMLKYRALGYWAARYAADWKDEEACDDVLPLPGEKTAPAEETVLAEDVEPIDETVPAEDVESMDEAEASEEPKEPEPTDEPEEAEWESMPSADEPRSSDEAEPEEEQ